MPPVEVAVPPFAMGKIPVTSEARFTSAVDIAPAVAFKNPERPLMVSEPTCAAAAKRLVLLAVVAKLLVEVALVVVEVSTNAPPCTSSWLSVLVEAAPIST